MPRSKSKQKLRKNQLKVARKKYAERKKERLKLLKEQSVSAISESTPTVTKRATVTRKTSH
ncbi:MAG: hypothetical protein N2450_06320 [bacterium]|nr:hypothetical protein [bacterium]